MTPLQGQIEQWIITPWYYPFSSLIKRLWDISILHNRNIPPQLISCFWQTEIDVVGDGEPSVDIVQVAVTVVVSVAEAVVDCVVVKVAVVWFLAEVAAGWLSEEVAAAWLSEDMAVVLMLTETAELETELLWWGVVRMLAEAYAARVAAVHFEAMCW